MKLIFGLHSKLLSIRPNGRICSVGFSSGMVPTVSLQELISRQATVMGVWLGGYAHKKPKELQVLVDQIISYMDESYIDPFIARKFQLAQVSGEGKECAVEVLLNCFSSFQVNEALQYVDSQSSLGKTVLQMV